MCDLASHLEQILVKKERYAEAESLLRKAIAGYVRINGRNGPRNLLALKYLMESLTLGGKLDEAEDVLLRVLAGDEMYGLPVDPDALKCLGLIYKNLQEPRQTQ